MEKDVINPVKHKVNYKKLNISNLDKIGGIDISPVSDDNGLCVVTITVLSYPSLEILKVYNEISNIIDDYVPSFLAIRESKPIEKAFKNFIKTVNINDIPSIFFVDGNGRLHERECGLATQIGVELDIITIGVSKNYYPINSKSKPKSQSTSKLFKDSSQHLLSSRGDFIGLFDKTSSYYLGVALLTSNNSKNPIFVSSGNKITLECAIALTLMTTSNKFKIPQSIRIADMYGRKSIRNLVNDNN